MNPDLMAALAQHRIRETLSGAARPASPPRSQHVHRVRLRRQIGIALVETGLRLLATTPPVPGR